MKVRDKAQIAAELPLQHARDDAANPSQAIDPSSVDQDLARAMTGRGQVKKVTPSGSKALLALQVKQKMVATVVPLDGHVVEGPLHFRDLSARGQHLVRQLEKTGSVRVKLVDPNDLVQVSKFFGRELAVLQTADDDRLRVVLGTENRVSNRQLRPGERFIVHTHPVYSSRKDHFTVDVAPKNAGKYAEMVLDWSGHATYLQDMRILNPIGPGEYIQPMPNYRPPFVDERGMIVGYKSFTEDGDPEHKRRRL